MRRARGGDSEGGNEIDPWLLSSLTPLAFKHPTLLVPILSLSSVETRYQPNEGILSLTINRIHSAPSNGR